MRAAQMWLDMTILIVMLAISTILAVPLFIQLGVSPVKYTEDKTALDVQNAAYLGNVEKTGADVLMGLMVTDEYTPYPRAIRLNNNPVIKLDNVWIANKYTNVASIYSGTQNLKGMVNWRVTSVEYIDDPVQPYIKYTLKP